MSYKSWADSLKARRGQKPGETETDATPPETTSPAAPAKDSPSPKT